MSAALQNAQEVVAGCMDDMLRLFKKGAKVTVLIRTPSHPDGTRDFVMTNDDLRTAIEALRMRAAAEKDNQP